MDKDIKEALSRIRVVDKNTCAVTMTEEEIELDKVLTEITKSYAGDLGIKNPTIEQYQQIKRHVIISLMAMFGESQEYIENECKKADELAKILNVKCAQVGEFDV
jgi:hypothetical protein